MPLKRAVTEFGKTYKDRFALRTYPGTSVPIFIFILGWSRTKPRVTLSAQTMRTATAGRASGHLAAVFQRLRWLVRGTEFTTPELRARYLSLRKPLTLTSTKRVTLLAVLSTPKPGGAVTTPYGPDCAFNGARFTV